MSRSSILILLILFTAGVTASSAKTRKSDHDKSIRVLITPFHNGTGIPGNNYISSEISDILHTLLDNNEFISIIEVDNSTRHILNSYNRSGYIWEDSLIDITTKLEPEIIVYGYYTVIDNTIFVYIQLLNCHTRKPVFSISTHGETGFEVYERIKLIVIAVKNKIQNVKNMGDS